MSSKKPFAAFTIVRNEPFFLRLWCDYYSREFGAENLYILDNSTTDGSVLAEQIKRPAIHVKPVPSDQAFAWGWTTEVIKAFQRAALNAYDVVVYADADEFLLPSAQYPNLRQFCEAFRQSAKPYVRATGWGVIHQIDQEPLLTAASSAPLADRNAMWRAPMYDKTLISKVPLQWAKGLHTIYDAAGKKLLEDPTHLHLGLLHLRDIDIGILHQRCIDRSRMMAFEGKVGLSHGSTELGQLQMYFRTLRAPWAPRSQEFVGAPQPIPDHWKQLMKLG